MRRDKSARVRPRGSICPEGATGEIGKYESRSPPPRSLCTCAASRCVRVYIQTHTRTHCRLPYNKLEVRSRLFARLIFLSGRRAGGRARAISSGGMFAASLSLSVFFFSFLYSASTLLLLLLRSLPIIEIVDTSSLSRIKARRTRAKG